MQFFRWRCSSVDVAAVLVLQRHGVQSFRCCSGVQLFEDIAALCKCCNPFSNAAVLLLLQWRPALLLALVLQ